MNPLRVLPARGAGDFLVDQRQMKTSSVFHGIRFLAAASAAAWSLTVDESSACTGLMVEAKDKTTVVARTLEFGIDIKSDIIFVPRSQSFTGVIPDGGNGMSWENKYAYIGENFFGQPYVVDGFNEQGLYVGLFYFPMFSEFEEVTDNNRASSIAQYQLPSWILGNCGTVEEVRMALASIVVGNVFLEEMNQVVPAHFLVVDRDGNAITIEYVSGKRQVYDNPVGVLTNAPPFGFMMTNLSQFVNLSAENAEPIAIDGFKINPTGQGSGMVGLPGDFTPPSRFVRAAYLSRSALPAENAAQAITQAINLINNITIVSGAIRGPESDGSVSLDYTLWTTINDLDNGVLYFRTQDNTQVRKVEFSDFKLDGTQIMTIPMDQEVLYPSVSSSASPLETP